MEVMPARQLRSQRSMADESGGEEILYPRHPHSNSTDIPALPANGFPTSDNDAGAPPSAFSTPPQRPRKRTSEEFELDNGNLVSKISSANATPSTAKDKEKSRRHRSLGVGMPSQVTPKEKVKDRRRDTLSVSVRHSRQGSSSSSHGEAHHPRRMHNSDFSH